MNAKMVDEQEQQSKPTLVYFKARGHAQIVRYVLLEIGVDFQQLFVGCNGYLDPSIMSKHQIDLKSLPYLIDGDLSLFGIFPIIKYLCLKYNRTDLLGKTFDHQLFIAEFMVKQMREKGIILNTLFKGIKEVYEKKIGEQGLLDVAKKIVESVEKTKNFELIKSMILQMIENKGKYLLGYLTILDFAVYQRTFYATNLICSNFQQAQMAKKHCQLFSDTQFYQRNKERIEKYKIFFPQFDCNLNNIFKKMWIGDTKFFEYG